MSRYEYDYAKELVSADPPFYGLIMAAMMKADSANEERLCRIWPGLWNELQRRYSAPGGVLPEDPETGEEV